MATCHRLAARAPAVDRLEVDDLAELVAALSPSSARLTRNEAAAVVAAMLRSADVDELIPRAIVQALIPGVLALAQRFDISEGPWSDLDAFFSDATGQGLAVADAAVLYATSVLGLSLAELSDLGGEPVPRLPRQRGSAIVQLVA
jgi:hypothetical protein